MDDSWHLSKSIPIGIFVAIVAQTITIVWWASDINTRVDGVEKNIVSLNLRPPAAASAETRITKLEARYEEIQRRLGKIDDKLDRLLIVRPVR